MPSNIRVTTLPYLPRLSINNTVNSQIHTNNTILLHSTAEDRKVGAGEPMCSYEKDRHRKRKRTSWCTIKPKVPCHHCEHEKSSYMTVNLLAVVQYGVSLHTWYEMPITFFFTLFTTASIQQTPTSQHFSVSL
jgi:hypothetical protein